MQNPVADGNTFGQDYVRPSRLFVVTIAGIFLAELLEMAAVYIVRPDQFWIETLLDASIMIVLIFPIVYLFAYRPLLQQVVKRRRSEELLERAFNSIDTLIAYLDRDFNFVRVNETYARSAGHPVEFFPGKNHFDLYPHAENEAIFQRVVATGEPVSVVEKPFEYHEYPERGVTYWNWSVQPVKNTDGTVQGVVLSLLDVTERKRAQERLEQQSMENARLYEAEARARRIAETLSAASLALTQTLDLETVLDALLEHAGRLVDYDAAYVAITESESKLALRAARGYASEADPGMVLGASFEATELPYLQEVLSTKASLLIRDTREYPGWTGLGARDVTRTWLGIPVLAGGKPMGILALAHAEPGGFSTEQVRLAEAIVAQAAVAIQNAWLFEQVRAGHERLQSLSRRLVEVQESERRYIARELHDETSQTLTALMFGLQLMETEIDQPEKLLPRVMELKRLTDGVLEELHRLAMDLRPASLDHLGLPVAIEQLVQGARERYGLDIRLRIAGFPAEDRLPDYVETSLYRIVQEALTNAARHARASNVDVILELRDGKCTVIVEDDGVGFDAGRVRPRGHLGLMGMHERAQMLGGDIQIESRTGGGTTVAAEVPCDYSNIDRR